MSDQTFLLDSYSLKILLELQRDARQTVQQLSEAVGLSASPCWRRVKDMESAGIIRGYTVQVDREKVGLNLAVVIEANLTQHSPELVDRFETAVAAIPEVVRCMSTTGSADYIIAVLVSDIKHYEQFLHNVIFKLPGITRVRSSIVLKEVKSEAPLPIDGTTLGGTWWNQPRR